MLFLIGTFKYVLIYITKVIRIFEAFAGIGAQRKALRNIKSNYEVSGMAEWYIPAIVSYQAIHNGFTLSRVDKKTKLTEMIKYLESKTLSMDSKEPVRTGYWFKKHKDMVRIVYSAVKLSEAEGNIFDVRTLHERKLEDIDLLTYSFPCQDLSQQGKQRGMKKDSGTRSGLLWEIEKALEATPKDKLPKYLLMENVVALTHKTNKKDLDNWKRKLRSLGYYNDINVLNAGDFGSSQARRRAFMISTLDSKVTLPLGDKKPQAISKILNKETRSQDFMPALDEYEKTDFKRTLSNIKKCKLIDYTSFNSEAYVYDPKYTGPTLTASGANSRIKFTHQGKMRKINAEEAYRYMGFSTNDYKKVNNLNFLSETKMIYTCGNSISVEVLEEIMLKIIREDNNG
ncbi:DNA cytosine methyltransferase [Mycoplasma marinum]|uniref:DNA (cytosine-5-)-methyltransferase n=1 Tax=Mycoplasma marinum TaxID=1937190 RepID=A0A4R0XIX6_9MOLU|nr:DNA cytosine methyltransferase [Mycoplasma marinum]TCG10364.1 DNA methyltransferase [Mycoplasma marinum]